MERKRHGNYAEAVTEAEEGQAEFYC
jgi:hypothetical protein